MTDNILAFPKNKIVREVPPELEEELAKKKEKSRQNYADAMVEDFVGSLYGELENCGLDTSEVNFQKDFVFAAAALKATVYRNLGIEHPLHKMIDKSVHIRTLPLDSSPEEIAKLLQEMIEQHGNVEQLDSDDVLSQILQGVDEDAPKE